jgi:hypothetical protein
MSSSGKSHGSSSGRTGITRFALGALVGSLLAIATILGAGLTPASAHASRSCLGIYDYGAINDHQNDGNPSTNRGTRASMHIISPGNVDCQHVSSIYAASPSSDANVEFAYLIGWSSCAASGGLYYEHPTLFYWSLNASGGVQCLLFGDVVPGSSDKEFRVSDPNNNGYWNVFYGGTSEGVSIHNDFNNSDNVISMERATSADSGYAKWTDLEEYKTGVSAWSAWDQNHCWGDADPSYSCHVLSNQSSVFNHD